MGQNHTGYRGQAPGNDQIISLTRFFFRKGRRGLRAGGNYPILGKSFEFYFRSKDVIVMYFGSYPCQKDKVESVNSLVDQLERIHVGEGGVW